jgi:hypothetical protein
VANLSYSGFYCTPDLEHNAELRIMFRCSPTPIYKIPIPPQRELPISWNIAPSQDMLIIRFRPKTPLNKQTQNPSHGIQNRRRQSTPAKPSKTGTSERPVTESRTHCTKELMIGTTLFTPAKGRAQSRAQNSFQRKPLRVGCSITDTSYRLCSK